MYRQVIDAAASVVAVTNFASASQGIAATTLRAVIGDIVLDDVLARREQINDHLRAKLDEVTERWGVKVTAVENSHFHFPPASPAYGKTKSYSYRFETPEKTIVFTGDTGPSEALTELAKGADMLVTEISSFDDVKELALKNGRWERMSREEQASFDHHMKEEHLSPDEVGRMASRAAVKTVVLTHIPATSDPKDEYKRYADAVKTSFSGQVLIASDLMQF